MREIKIDCAQQHREKESQKEEKDTRNGRILAVPGRRKR